MLLGDELPESQPIYEKVTTTGRSAEWLARLHGYGSVALLADSLPPEANVLDLGAGASTFGIYVGRLRPDITWVNVDYSYRDAAILSEVSSRTVRNVHYVAGDATDLLQSSDTNFYDRVFSYWLFPHLSIDEPEPAIIAARGVHDVLKSSGVASIGPRVNVSHILGLRWRDTFQEVKSNSYREVFAQRTLYETQLPLPVRRYHHFKYELISDFFGTTRWRKGGLIYSPDSGTYVPTLSREGVKVFGIFGGTAVRKMILRV